MAAQARGNFCGMQGTISIDRNSQPVIMAVQAVSATRLCGRKMQKFVEERFTSIHHDVRKGFSSSVERVGPQVTWTVLTEEESLVGNFLRASSNVARESFHDSSREEILCGKDPPIGSAYRNGDIEGRLPSHVGTRRSQSITKVQGINGLRKDKNGERNIVPTASGSDVRRNTSQVSRGSGNIRIPSVRTTSEALAILKNRQQQGLMIDSYTFVEVLKRCLKQRDLTAARQVHDCIIQSGMENNPYVANTLLNVYIRCGRLQDARRVFDGLDEKTAFTWTIILKACASPLALKWGKEVHLDIIHAGLESDVRVGTALVQMYAKCGCITEARRVFEKLGTNRNVITWNVMIGAYAESGLGQEAYELFLQMQQEGLIPDAITYVSILNASASAGSLAWVKAVHSHALKAGLESDLRVGNVLVHMYAKSGGIEEARPIFERLKRRDVVTWNTMIGAYAEHGCGVEAYRLFLQMQQEGFIPNAITYVAILNSSASAGDLEWVKEVHEYALKAGLQSDLRVATALVYMYAKIGSLDDARLLFDSMGKRDVIMWNTMIGAYSENGCGMEAYRLFLQMQREGFIPDAATYVNILNASASAGALEWVKEVHECALKARIESDLRVGTALVHMYAKIGTIDDAWLIFDKMKKRDVVTWNIMIGALAQHGCGQQALELFRKMIADSVRPDETTFVAVFSACCHAGLLDDGRRLFLAMKQNYGIEPTVVHYTCMVDLLGRAGLLEEAKLFIDNMPVEPVGVTWKALLGACRTYGNVELGELASEELLKLEPKDASAYVLLSNIYAAAGKWEKVSLVRTMMEENGVRKEPGRSWIEVDNKIHEFVVGDTSHPEAKAIYAELNKLTERLKVEGYIPDTQRVLQNIDDEDKELALCSHSEKLAIAYGLIRTPRGRPIRIYKNLRVCPDCHAATKVISKVTGREIIARDVIRFHHFKDGVCSCGDYW